MSHHSLFADCRIQQFFMELMSNTCSLKWLTTSFMVGLVTPASLDCLSNASAESLQHLSILNHQLGMCNKDQFLCWCGVDKNAFLYCLFFLHVFFQSP